MKSYGKNGYLVDIDPSTVSHHGPPQQRRSKRRGHKSAGAYIGFVPLQPRISQKKSFSKICERSLNRENIYEHNLKKKKKHMKTCSSPVLVDFRWILDAF